MPIRSHIKLTILLLLEIGSLPSRLPNEESMHRHKAQVTIHDVYVYSFIVDKGLIMKTNHL